MMAGISTGKTLIEAARINKFYQEIAAYKQAIRMFEDQYGYLPGDVPQAMITGELGLPNVYLQFSGTTTLADGVISACDSRNAFRQLALGRYIDGSSLNANGAVSCSYLNISSPNANILNDVINGLLPSSYAMQNVAFHVTSLTPTTDINGNTIPSEANGITKIIDSPFLYGINAGKLAIIAFGVSSNAGFGSQNVSILAAVSPSAAAVTTKLMVKIDYKYDNGSPHTGSMIALKNR